MKKPIHEAGIAGESRVVFFLLNCIAALVIIFRVYFNISYFRYIFIRELTLVKIFSVVLSTWAHSNQFNDYSSMPYYEQAFVEQNNIVKKIGRSLNAPVYDFASEMPPDRSYWADGRHVNEEGAKVKGELFAKYVYKSRLIHK